MKIRTREGTNKFAGPKVRMFEIFRTAKRRSFLATSMALVALSIAPGALAGNSGNAAQGKATFQERCAVCHGADASGHTAIAKALGTIPDYRSNTVQSLTDAQIRVVITDGKGKMPPVKGVSATEIKNLIAFIRSLAKK
ncbi:MAG: c-type cytochrome [Candidatus Acidiferrales bacterium]